MKSSYTYEEVKDILCDACRLNVPFYRDCDREQWMHVINRINIPCSASRWRNKIYEKKHSKSEIFHEDNGC